MSLRERIHEFQNKRTLKEMCHIAAVEVVNGGVFNVELGKGNEREFLNITNENIESEFPKFMALMADSQNVGKEIKFTILDRDHKKVDGFSGKMRASK